jgi:hypothetical protein
MRRLLSVLVILAVTLSLTGCFGAAVTSPAARQGAQAKDLGASWFWGLRTTTSRASECVHGLAEVETFIPFYSWFVGAITAGIVFPIKKEYVCAAPSRR